MEDLYDLVARKAIEAGLIVVVEGRVEGTDVFCEVVSLTDRAGLTALFKEVVAEVAQGEYPELGVRAALFGLALDRVVNRGITDPEAASDMTAPYVLPLNCTPGQLVGYLKPVISVGFVDVVPSSGLDLSSLSLTIDGRPLPAILELDDTGRGGTLITVPHEPIFQGRHVLEVGVADSLGQTKTASWNFDIVLNLRWLAPINTRGGAAWLAKQAVPVRFDLRDDDGTFWADPGVTVRVYDPGDPTGKRSVEYPVGSGPNRTRISESEEIYVAVVRLSGISWVETGGPVAIAVEAGGLRLGEISLALKP